MQRKRGGARGRRDGEDASQHGLGAAPHFTRVDQVNALVWPRGSIWATL